MARRSHPEELRRAVSWRLYAIIRERGFTLTGFRTALAKRGYKKLSSAAGNWFPPLRLWAWESSPPEWRPLPTKKSGKVASKAAQRTDWNRVRLPDSVSIREFCEFTGASADYLLLGVGAAFRGQSRSNVELKEDLRSYLQREAGVAEVPGFEVTVNIDEVLQQAADTIGRGYAQLISTLQEFADWIGEARPATSVDIGRRVIPLAPGANKVAAMLQRYAPTTGLHCLEVRPTHPTVGDGTTSKPDNAARHTAPTRNSSVE